MLRLKGLWYSKDFSGRNGEHHTSTGTIETFTDLHKTSTFLFICINFRLPLDPCFETSQLIRDARRSIAHHSLVAHPSPNPHSRGRSTPVTMSRRETSPTNDHDGMSHREPPFASTEASGETWEVRVRLQIIDWVVKHLSLYVGCPEGDVDGYTLTDRIFIYTEYGVPHPCSICKTTHWGTGVSWDATFLCFRDCKDPKSYSSNRNFPKKFHL